MARDGEHLGIGQRRQVAVDDRGHLGGQTVVLLLEIVTKSGRGVGLTVPVADQQDLTGIGNGQHDALEEVRLVGDIHLTLAQLCATHMAVLSAMIGGEDVLGFVARRDSGGPHERLVRVEGHHDELMGDLRHATSVAGRS